MNTATTSTNFEAPSRTRAAPKTQQLLALLSRSQGATIGEITAAIGLLPHSARAALTGLRKKGHALIKNTRDGVTCYSIEEVSK